LADRKERRLTFVLGDYLIFSTAISTTLKYAIEAVAKIAKRVPNIDYHIIGSGPPQDELKALVAELDLNPNVTCLDTISGERLITGYNKARRFPLPCVIAESGNRDGIPVALIETIAMKTPCLDDCFWNSRTSDDPERIRPQRSRPQGPLKRFDGTFLTRSCRSANAKGYNKYIDRRGRRVCGRPARANRRKKQFKYCEDEYQDHGDCGTGVRVGKNS
jgi:hypothetical protein